MNKEIFNQRERTRELLENIKQKCEDDFEKNITYISAGTLVLSLTFIEKIVNLNNSAYTGILISAWVLLALTLLINLISHQISSYYHQKTILDFDNNIPDINTKIRRRNKRLICINWGTIISLILGIFTLILFCSININTNKMASNTNSNDSKNLNSTKKGRTITVPTPNEVNSILSSSSTQTTTSNQFSNNSSDGKKK